MATLNRTGTCRSDRPYLVARQDSRSSPADDPVLIKQHPTAWSAIGSKQQLISSGLCTLAHFPEGRKRFKRDCDSDGRWWDMSLERAGVWRLRVDLSEAEKTSKAIANAMRKANLKKIEETPATAQEWKAKMLDWVGFNLRCVRRALTSDCGCELDETSFALICTLLDGVEGGIRSASPKLDQNRRAQFLEEIEAEMDADGVVRALRPALKLVSPLEH